MYKLILLVLTLFLASCTQNRNTLRLNSSLHQLSLEDLNHFLYRGSYKIGNTYVERGKHYTPKKYLKYEKIGIASWYGGKCGFHRKKTANGDIFNKNLLTAAHRTLPLPSVIEVTNLKNKKSVILLVNDRGPFIHNREIDVSEKAAKILDMKRSGIAKVRVKYLHNETQKFLNQIGLKSKHGAKAQKKLSHCSVNCQIKLVNLKYKKQIR